MSSSFKGNNFDSGRVTLDGNIFEQCHFRNCTLEFGGTGPVAMNGCEFENVKWSFVGPAGATLNFLAAMANDLGEGGRQIVEHTFMQIMKRDEGNSTKEASIPTAPL